MKITLTLAGIAMSVAFATSASAVAASGDQCLKFDPAKATILGKASLGHFPSGHTFAEVVPDKPVCITGGAANQYRDAQGLTAIALYFGNNSVLPKKWLGKHVAVTGLLQQGDPVEVATPNFMHVDSIAPAP
ncbi:hypothetical protein [Caballeronia sp. M23-90]